jgi:hypothetical protein
VVKRVLTGIEKESAVPKRVQIIIDEEIFRRAKRRAAEEGGTLSEIVQEALVSYLGNRAPDLGKREKAYRIFSKRPVCLSRNQFQQILREDSWSS